MFLRLVVIVVAFALSLPEPVEAQSSRSAFNNAAANARMAQQRNQAMQMRLRQQEQLRADRLRANRERQAAQQRAIRTAQRAQTLARQKVQAEATRAAQQSRDRVRLEARKLQDLQQQAIRTRLMAGTALSSSKITFSASKVTLPSAKQVDVKAQLASLPGRKTSIDGTRQTVSSTTARPSLTKALRANSLAGPSARNDHDAKSVTRLKFGKNDLVYGPTANGALTKLVKRAGGATLNNELSGFRGTVRMENYSKQKLAEAANSGRQVHFDLTHVKDIKGVLSNTGPFANRVTSQELRFIRDNWRHFKTKPKFYENDIEVAPPWRE